MVLEAQTEKGVPPSPCFCRCHIARLARGAAFTFDRPLVLHSAFRLSRTSRHVHCALRLTSAASNSGLRLIAKDAYQ
eukprot:6072283-Prymnesium_polylepis.1